MTKMKKLEMCFIIYIDFVCEYWSPTKGRKPYYEMSPLRDIWKVLFKKSTTSKDQAGRNW